MIIKIEENQNENRRHFFPSEKLRIPEVVFFSKSDPKNPKAAEDVLSINGVENVLMADDFVSVVKSKDADWAELEPQIMAWILDFAQSGEPILWPETDLNLLIEALLDALVRPFLQKDGGNVEVLEFKDHILYVRFLGKCQGCPLSANTLKNVVERALIKYMPQISAVRQKETGA